MGWGISARGIPSVGLQGVLYDLITTETWADGGKGLTFLPNRVHARHRETSGSGTS